MRTAFVEQVAAAIIEKDPDAAAASWLAVCAGGEERDFFEKRGFRDVTIANLDERLKGDEFAPFRWSRQNAQALTFANASFDYVFVSDGLHHCSSPHRALTEMYRVARKAIVVVESRDSLMVRLAERLGLAERYETAAVMGNAFVYGGVDNGPIPNFVYRWTERELAKTISSFDPTGPQEFRFLYALNLPERNNMAGRLLRIGAPAIETIAKLFPRQCNSFAMIATKPQSQWPWLERDGERTVFRQSYTP